MFVCDIGCPRSPGKRTRKKTTPGAAVRVTPDKVHSASDALSPGPRGSWSASPSTVRRATPTQEYNLSLAEMRHYKDEDTMVLILSQNSAPAEEAEYPVPMEQDTSELLDAEDDDTLAGYAEVASRLVRPSPLQLPTYNVEDSTRDPARRLFYDDDVCHEQFHSHTYEAASRDSNGSAHSAPSPHVQDNSEQLPAQSHDMTDHGTPGFFKSEQAPNGSNEWSPAEPVVEPWMAQGDHSGKIDHLSSSADTAHNGDQPSSSEPAHSRSAAAERSKSRGRAFSPSGSNGRYSGSASPKVHNGSIHRSARAHNGASSGSNHQPNDTSQPTTAGGVRVSNGARPQSSRETRSEQRRASGRDMRSQSLPPGPLQGEAELSSPDATPTSEAKSGGFWEQWTAPAGGEDSSIAGGPATDDSSVAGVQHGEEGVADYQQPGSDRLQEVYSPKDAQPFFSSQVPRAVRQPGRTHQADDSRTESDTEPFFQINPTVPQDYKASIPIHYPRRPVPKLPPGIKQSRSTSEQNGVLQTEFPANEQDSPRQNQHESTIESDKPLMSQGGEQEVSSGSSQEADDPRTGSDKILESQDDHASRTFARAVSHSSLPSAMPEHSVRRGASSQRNSATRRSSRRDAHMQTRIAKLDTSNLSHYSLPTLQRLAKDMGLSHFSRLSKSELVVQLVAEIILANMTLGWSVPEVAHGHLDEEAAGDGEGPEGQITQPQHEGAGSQQSVPQRSGSRLSGSPRTVYRFGESYDSEDDGYDSVVEVTQEVSPETVQRGQDVFARIKHWLPFRGGKSQQAGRDDISMRVQQKSSENRQGEWLQSGQSRLVTGAAQVALGGANVEEDFESLSALSMNKLQELCEDLGVEGWQRMRKYEMVGALLMDVYGLQH